MCPIRYRNDTNATRVGDETTYTGMMLIKQFNERIQCDDPYQESWNGGIQKTTGLVLLLEIYLTIKNSALRKLPRL